MFVGKIVGEMTKVYSLLDVIPVYKSENEKINEHEVIDWLAEQNEMGNTGEKIIRNFLELKYQAVVEKKPDYAGYDFGVTIGTHKFAVEVKTTEHHINKFYISYNELKTAAELREDYYIYRLHISGNRKILFIIKDPITLPKIDQSLLGNIIVNDVISARIDGLAITLNDTWFSSNYGIRVYPLRICLFSIFRWMCCPNVATLH